MTRREYVLDRITPEPNSGCWFWDLSTGSHGYGQGLDPEEKKVTVAHRISYRAFKGEIPEGFHVDHKCRNRICVNPDHLEAVPQAENNRRAIPHRGKGGGEAWREYSERRTAERAASNHRSYLKRKARREAERAAA